MHLQHAYRIGLCTGDIEYAFLAKCVSFWSSRDRLFATCKICVLSERMECLGQEVSLVLIRPLLQIVHNFSGRASGEPKRLSGSIMDQDSVFDQADGNPSLVLWSRFHCMVLAYFFSDFKLAADFSKGTEQLYDSNNGAMDSAYTLCYECMSLLAVARKHDARVKRVRRLSKRLLKWAAHATKNFLRKQYLVEAEFAMVGEEISTATPKWNETIAHSRDGGFLMQVALAFEWTGKCHLMYTSKEIAIPLLQKTYNAYEKWGGMTKCEHLRKEASFYKIYLS